MLHSKLFQTYNKLFAGIRRYVLDVVGATEIESYMPSADLKALEDAATEMVRAEAVAEAEAAPAFSRRSRGSLQPVRDGLEIRPTASASDYSLTQEGSKFHLRRNKILAFSEVDDDRPNQPSDYAFSAPQGLAFSESRAAQDRQAISYCLAQGWDPSDLYYYRKAIRVVLGQASGV